MSSFLRAIVGAAKSNTVQFNSIMLAIWTAIYNSDFVQTNPEYVAILGGVQALLNMFLRAKTQKPLVQR